jgi:serine/threonine-protein kinase
MNRDRWREIRSIFDEVVELPRATRTDRLAAAAATDPELGRAVEALLQAEAEAEAELAARFPMLHGSRERSADPLGLNGRTLGHFRIIAPLGSGGMGAVYAAEDVRLGRLVALKLPLPAHRPDSAARARFLQEARSVGALDHPNLCSLHDVGETEDGLLYLAMALYRGETLKARLAREGALPIPDAVGIARRICRGLGAAHEAGIVHRDLKPANVMLPDGGEVKILDFGLAKVRDMSLTGDGAVLGTVGYMSPEQIRNAAVDGRTDLWALGGVLYEMLTGRQPFRAALEVAVAHSIVHEAPVPPSDLRPDIPAALEELVLSLLEKDPARRPARADLVEGELDAAAAGRPRRGRPRRDRLRVPARRVALAGLAVAAASAGVAAYGTLRSEPALFQPNLLAVAPFEAADTSLQLWREGMVDMLALDLDGAGPLRTVPQSVVLRRWSGRADRVSAEALGRRTGAELVVFGHLVRRGPDSVQIRAKLLDRSRDVVEQDLEIVGEEQRIGALADSLGVAVLRTLGRTRPIGSHRQGAIGSRTLPALKEFLRGEQFYRQGLWDSALVRYDRALAADSAFALALRRLAHVRAWRSAQAAPYASQSELLRRAVVLNRGLAPRDSALLTADSFDLAALDARTADELVAWATRAHDSREAMARRFPDDPEIWYHVGERRMHAPVPFGDRPEPALEAFERSIALDPSFAPAYSHVLELSLLLDRPAMAAHYARTYPAPAGNGDEAMSFRLASLLFDSGGVHAPALRRALRAAGAGALDQTGSIDLRWLTDTAETAVVILRELVTGKHDISEATPPLADSAYWRSHLAAALAFRGHLALARDEFGALLDSPERSFFAAFYDPFDDLALLGTIPDSLSERMYGRGLRQDTDWNVRPSRVAPRHLRGLSWWHSRGDTVSIARFARRAAETVRAAVSPIAVLRGRYFGAAAAAYLTLARGDSAGAIRALESISDTLCMAGACVPEKLLLARLHAASGNDRVAATILDRWGRNGGALPTAVLAQLERGRIAERLGEGEVARDRYRFVVDAWRRADPRLRPYVADAERGLRAMRAEQ